MTLSWWPCHKIVSVTFTFFTFTSWHVWHCPRSWCDNALDRGRCDNALERGRCDNALDRGKCDNALDRGRCDNALDRGRCDNALDRGRCDNALYRCRFDMTGVTMMTSYGVSAVPLVAGDTSDMTQQLFRSDRISTLHHSDPDLSLVAKKHRQIAFRSWHRSRTVRCRLAIEMNTMHLQQHNWQQRMRDGQQQQQPKGQRAAAAAAAQWAAAAGAAGAAGAAAAAAAAAAATAATTAATGAAAGAGAAVAAAGAATTAAATPTNIQRAASRIYYSIEWVGRDGGCGVRALIIFSKLLSPWSCEDSCRIHCLTTRGRQFFIK